MKQLKVFLFSLLGLSTLPLAQADNSVIGTLVVEQIFKQ